MTRRMFVAGAAGLIAAPAVAQPPTSPPGMVVHKDPSCGCCTGWAEHIRAAGFQVEVLEARELAPVKARLGVPDHLAACHTAEISGFVVEGHVPASAIKRLLAERPDAVGLAVPGMPIGSPGMEVKGSPDERYEVILFGPAGQRIYARFQGAREFGS